MWTTTTVLGHVSYFKMPSKRGKFIRLIALTTLVIWLLYVVISALANRARLDNGLTVKNPVKHFNGKRTSIFTLHAPNFRNCELFSEVSLGHKNEYNKPSVYDMIMSRNDAVSLYFVVRWNLNLPSGKGLGKLVCYTRFCLHIFLKSRAENIVRFTEDFVISRFH